MNFEVEIIKHKLCRTPKIKIKNSNSVKVVLPSYLTKKAAFQLIESHQEWITTTLEKIRTKEAGIASIYKENKNKILLFGEWMELQIDPAMRKRYKLEENILTVKDRKHVDTFYKDLGYDFFYLNSNLFASKIDKKVGKISLRNQKTLWGSCNRHGDLSFNLKLLKAPKFVGEYVAAHEVAHLKERNHSGRFYNLVDSIFTQRNEAERWLKENSGLIRFQL